MQGQIPGGKLDGPYSYYLTDVIVYIIKSFQVLKILHLYFSQANYLLLLCFILLKAYFDLSILC